MLDEAGECLAGAVCAGPGLAEVAPSQARPLRGDPSRQDRRGRQPRRARGSGDREKAGGEVLDGSGSVQRPVITESEV